MGCPASVAASLAASHSVKADQAMLRLCGGYCGCIVASVVSSKHCFDLYSVQCLPDKIAS